MLFVIICACNSEEYFSHKYINEISKERIAVPSIRLPFYHGYLDLFVLVDSNKIAKTSIGSLSGLYKVEEEYLKSYSSFNLFLYDALNQKLVFKPDLFNAWKESVFSPDEKIRAIYHKEGVSFLVNHYFDREKDKFAIKRDSLTDEELNTVLYYCFLNNYEITFNDMMGLYYLNLWKNEKIK